MTTTQKLAAEFVGTLWLVLGGCGSAVLTVTYPWLNIGFIGISLAFGLSVLTMSYAVGRISGGHFNPAVTIGLTVGGSFESRLIVPYILAQVGGALAGAGLLYLILSGKPNFELGPFAANGYGEHSPGGFSLTAALVSEVVFTFIFLLVILGSTHKKAPRELAGIAIGMCLTLIHLVSIPITNTSVNPARSTSQALFVGNWALEQLWLFWLAPLAGAALAGVFYRTVIDNSARDPD